MSKLMGNDMGRDFMSSQCGRASITTSPDRASDMNRAVGRSALDSPCQWRIDSVLANESTLDVEAGTRNADGTHFGGGR